LAFTVYQTNKKTGVVYAYSQTAFRDPVTKRPKSKRTYLGRVDPATGEIVPKETDGKRNRSKLGVDTSEDEQSLDECVQNQTESEIIASLHERIEKLTAENKRLREVLGKIHDFSQIELDTGWIHKRQLI